MPDITTRKIINPSQIKREPLYARRSEDGTIQPIGMDDATNTLQLIDYAHHEIHSGNNFFCGSYVDLTNGQTYDILIATPDTTKWGHMLFKIATEAEGNFILYEDVTTSDDGTALNCFNRNRNSANTAGLSLYHTPTITDTGTELGRGKMGSGKQVGGEIRDVQEIIYKQNSKYLFRITNDTVSNNWLDYEFDWYEHTNN